MFNDYALEESSNLFKMIEIDITKDFGGSEDRFIVSGLTSSDKRAKSA
jgi:hypothetical protein